MKSFKHERAAASVTAASPKTFWAKGQPQEDRASPWSFMLCMTDKLRCKRKELAVLALALSAPGHATAQDLDWTYRATLYGWLPAMSTSVETAFGTVEGDASGSDVLSNLDFAFMGSFAAQRGRLGFVADLLYTDLSTAQDLSFPLYGTGIVDLQLTSLSGYALYRVFNTPKVHFDVGVGLRNFDMAVDVSLAAGILPAASQRLETNWTDPLIAARIAVPLNEDWFLQGFADVGGTGSDSNTWQVYGGVGYNFNEQWASQIGYRHMDINKEIGGNDVSIGLSGVVFALSYNF